MEPILAMRQLITARWLSSAVCVAARLGIADELAAGPKAPAEIAGAVGANADALRRVLRALASAGVFVEDANGRFANTPMSETLRSGERSLRSWATMIGSAPIERAWGELLHAVRTGECAFEKAHGAQAFEYLARDPEFARSFSEAMTSNSSIEAEAVTAAFDFSGVARLVDVGGGHGFLLKSVLARTPHTRGILFDLPAVVAGAGPVLGPLAERVEVIGGDFFKEMPRGADGYMMKHVLHDWDDQACVRILEKVKDAGAPNARVFVMDCVIPDGNDRHFGKLIDLQMLVTAHGGRERTRPEWERLFAAAGFTMTKLVGTALPLSVLEARRA